MLEDPPSILPRGTGTRRNLSPRPAFSPGSAVYIQSTSGLSCIAAQASGIDDTSGGRSPASISATRQVESSDSRAAITAPAEPPPTTTKSNVSGMLFPPGFNRHFPDARPIRASWVNDNGRQVAGKDRRCRKPNLPPNCLPSTLAGRAGPTRPPSLGAERPLPADWPSGG